MERTRFDELLKLKQETKLQLKDKPFKNMSSNEKDKLLETVCKLLNLI